MDNILFEDFQKLDIRVGKILSADSVPGSEKLLKLSVDFGEEERQVISGIAKSYTPEELNGKLFVFVINLEPRKIMGLESQAMLLAAERQDKAVLLQPNQPVEPGTKLL